MDAADLLPFLGHSPSDAAFGAFLDANRVWDRPHTAEQDDKYEEDPGQALENARASEIEEVERDSVCLIYEERDNYARLFGEPSSEGEFILKQVAFYAPGVHGYPGYKGELPAGLTLRESREQVRTRLGSPTASRVIHELPADLYVRDSLVLNVSYAEGSDSIAILHVRLPHLYDQRMLGVAEPVRDPRAVDLARLIACLDKSAYDETLEALLEPMGWQSSGFEMADCDEVPNLVRRYGVALYYRDARNYAALRGQRFARDGAVFAGFRVNRRGDMASEGYEGLLPFGIEFHHTPEQAIGQVGRNPDWVSIGDDIGAYRWRLPTHTLHVMFSLIDYQVYRVSCFAKFLEAELFKRAA